MFEELKELELLEIDGGAVKCVLHNRKRCTICMDIPLFFKDPELFAP